MTENIMKLYKIYALNPDHFPVILKSIYRHDILYLVEKIEIKITFLSEETCERPDRDVFIINEFRDVTDMFSEIISFSEYFLEFDITSAISVEDMKNFFLYLEKLTRLIIIPEHDSLDREAFIKAKDAALFGVKYIRDLLKKASEDINFVVEYVDITE